jgi:hypothetical protein
VLISAAMLIQPLLYPCTHVIPRQCLARGRRNEAVQESDRVRIPGVYLCRVGPPLSATKVNQG